MEIALLDAARLQGVKYFCASEPILRAELLNDSRVFAKEHPELPSYIFEEGSLLTGAADIGLQITEDTSGHDGTSCPPP